MVKSNFLAFMLISTLSMAYEPTYRNNWGYYNFDDQYALMFRSPYGYNRHIPNYYVKSSGASCNNNSVTYPKCLDNEPDKGELEWRFMEPFGWQKFTKQGAARMDWLDYKNSLQSPFHPTYGTLLGGRSIIR